MSTRASRSKSSASSLKQAKLSFATSKRTAAAKAAQKPKTLQSKSPSIVQIKPESNEEQERVQSSEEETVEVKVEEGQVAAPIKPSTQEKSDATKNEAPEEKVEPAPPKEELDENSPKWKKLHAATRQKMGHLNPIHAEGQNKIHEILRVFDMSFEYGPCAGVTRLERWERASALGMNPPKEVYEILMTRQGSEDTGYSQSVLYGEV